MIDLTKLHEPFSPAQTHWRVGSVTKKKDKCMPLAYIDARDVMERLDGVCGTGSWQCRYTQADQKTVCEIGIKIDGEWVWKANGAGDTDIEGSKGALSDAFKRAAVLWGIGRYLYGIKAPWVEIDEYKRIKDSQFQRLDNLLVKTIDAMQQAKSVSISDDTAEAIRARLAVTDTFPTFGVFESFVKFATGTNLSELPESRAEKLLALLNEKPDPEEWPDAMKIYHAKAIMQLEESAATASF